MLRIGVKNRWCSFRVRAGRDGVSLIEVMLAIAVLFFGLYGVVDLFQQQTRYVKRVMWEARADCLAHAYLARVQSMRFEELDQKIRLLAKPGQAADVARFFPGRGSAADDSDFQWNVELRRESAEGLPGRIRVAVQITPNAASDGLVDAMGMRAIAARKEAVCYVCAR